MNVDKLKVDLAEMQKSLQEWVTRKAQAEQTVAGAQRQIDVHNGHIERIGMWLREMEQPTETPQP